MGDSHCLKDQNQATRILILGILDFQNPETPKLTGVSSLYLSAILILGLNCPEKYFNIRPSSDPWILEIWKILIV